MSHIRRISSLSAVAVALFFLLGVHAANVRRPSVRVDSDQVRISLTVLDKNNAFVPSLRKEDIRLLDEGLLQEITALERQNDHPIALVILVDASISQERTLPNQKFAARVFVDSIFRPGKDQAAVGTFSGQATLEQDLTTDITKVRQAIDRIRFEPPIGYIGHGQVAGPSPGSGPNLPGSTAIWDAVSLVSDEILSQVPEGTRRAIIVLSDGYDTGSFMKMDEAIDSVLRVRGVIHSIGIGDAYYGGVDKNSLEKLSRRTGGNAFVPDKVKDLEAAFARIKRELEAQYIVSFTPTNKSSTAKLRRVKIEIINPQLRKQGLRLSHPYGYYAKPE